MADLIPLERLELNPWQTRPIDGAHAAHLAQDILEHGLLQTPLGRLMLDGRMLDAAPYGGVGPALGDEPDARVQLAVGHHRLAAFRQLAGVDPARWGRLPVDVRSLSDQEMALAAWAENAKRRDLTPIEEARAIQRMVSDFGWSQAEIAQRLGVDRSTAANKLRLLQLPEEVQAKVQAGELSERQAIALLPVATLPAPLRQAAEQTWQFRTLNQHIQSGAASDTLRNDVEGVLNQITHDLGQAVFQRGDVGLARRPACNGCEQRLGERCGNRSCFAAKTRAWIDDQIVAAWPQTQLPYVPREKQLADQVYTSRYQKFLQHEGEALAYAREAHCPHLHVAWDEHQSDYNLHPPGLGHLVYVCWHGGEEKRCACRKQAEERLHADEVAAEKERKRQRAEVKQRGVQALASVLASGQTGAWRAILYTLLTATDYHHRESALTIRDQTALQQRIAALILERCQIDAGDPALLQERYDRFCEQCGIVLDGHGLVGASLAERMAELARRWTRIEGWRSRLTRELPTLEAVRGNLQNLRALEDDLRAFAGEAATAAAVQADDPLAVEAVALSYKVRDALATLVEVADIMAEWDGEGFEDVDWLVHVSVGDVNFAGRLKNASAAAVRYALALAPQGKGQLERRAKLQRRVREGKGGAAIIR